MLIEGGATVNWNALSSGVVDKLFLFYAPKILGEGAVPFVASPADRDTPMSRWQRGAFDCTSLERILPSKDICAMLIRSDVICSLKSLRH